VPHRARAGPTRPQLACQIAAAHELEDVADSITVNLAKIPQAALREVRTRRPQTACDEQLAARTRTLTANRVAAQKQPGA
jgi:brefeldin A-resistance guanine nucleotide exchange factor 1